MSRTFLDAIKAAVDICILEAKIGQLPSRLSVDLSKDLFSGKEFEYEKTKEGFVLRCRDKDLGKNELYQYEFKVSK